MLLRGRKRGQVAMFIIVAIVIVGAIAGYFLLKRYNPSPSNNNFQDVENYYIDCMKDYTRNGVALLEERGGHIYDDNFEPGSDFAPTSSHLNYLGTGIPYWFYVSGNNIARISVPTKADMQKQLERYIDENFACDFSSFSEKGYVIEQGEVKSAITISDNSVKLDNSAQLKVSKENNTAFISKHSASIDTNLKKLYDEALRIYNKESTDNFFEKYALDVLHLNAPVNGVEVTCAPKVWKLSDIKESVKNSLEENIMMLKTKSSYYKTTEKGKYFVVDVPTSNSVQFLYSKDWPTKIETTDNQGIMIASPVGNQPGMGVIGFCYVPYHFVYDVSFPVLVKVYDSDEIFQFPVVAVIKGNKEREPLPGAYYGKEDAELCKYKNTNVEVKTYDASLNPVEADISFKCFNEFCDIGKTSIKNNEAVMNENFPQCVNGFVIAKAENYEEKREMASTNVETSVNLILDRIYENNYTLSVDGRNSSDIAVLSFVSGEKAKFAAWPEQKTLALSEGFYNITIYVYKNSSITIPGTSQEKCVQVSKPGLSALFGATEEKCFNIDIPGQQVSNILYAGGKSQQYITEDELKRGKIVINVGSIKMPATIEELQDTYTSIDNKNIAIDFK